MVTPVKSTKKRARAARSPVTAKVPVVKRSDLTPNWTLANTLALLTAFGKLKHTFEKAVNNGDGRTA